MDIFERLFYLVLGVAIGFIVGYITRSLRDMKEELDEVDDIVKEIRRHDDAGVVDNVLIMRISLAIVVILTAFAAFSSQRANNHIDSTQKQLVETQSQLAHQTMCNRTVLRDALVALNQRTTYSEAQVNTNVALQTSFAEMLGILLHEPPFSDRKRANATSHYYQDLTNYVSIADKTKQKVRANPFPSDKALDACLSTGEPEGNSK